MTTLTKCPNCGSKLEVCSLGEYTWGCLYLTYCIDEDGCGWELEEID